MPTTADAAAKLKAMTGRAIALIRSGRLGASKIGRDWMIEEKALAAVRVRKPGRPKGRANEPTITKGAQGRGIRHRSRGDCGTRRRAQVVSAVVSMTGK